MAGQSLPRQVGDQKSASVCRFAAGLSRASRGVVSAIPHGQRVADSNLPLRQRRYSLLCQCQEDSFHHADSEQRVTKPGRPPAPTEGLVMYGEHGYS